MNPLGSPEANDQPGLAALLPFRPAERPDQRNPVIREFERLNENLPPAPSHVHAIPLTDQEQHDYEADVGPKIEATVAKLMASPVYQRMNDAQKAAVLHQVTTNLHAAEADLALVRMGAPEFRRRLLQVKKAA